MKKYLMNFLLILVVLSCSEDMKSDNYRKQNDNKARFEEYPPIIDSLDLRVLYDSAKWQVYLLKYADTPKYLDGTYLTDSALGFASLPLNFDSLGITGDTFSIYFIFYLNDTVAISPHVLPSLYNASFGMMFSKSMKPYSVCFVTRYSVWSYECKIATSKEQFDSSTSRMLKPLQPYVVAYINENKSILHPWFYKEAVRRGVIKEEEQK